MCLQKSSVFSLGILSQNLYLESRSFGAGLQVFFGLGANKKITEPLLQCLAIRGKWFQHFVFLTDPV